MPVTFYVGVPRSGKSYLIIKQVIVPAIAEGRTVVTNLDGVNESAIHLFLIKEKKLASDRLGKIVTVKDEDWRTGHCFPSADSGIETTIHGGDLVCIDEAQMFWGYGDKLSQLHLEFLTQHGHYVDPETKRCCDVVLATQDLRLINRKALGVVDKTFKVERKDEMGMGQTFIVSTFSGASLSRSNFIACTLPEKYDKRYFDFYHSFSGGQGVVASVDSNSNIFKSKKYRWAALIVLLLLIYSVTSLMSFFGKAKTEPLKVAPGQTVPPAGSSPAHREASPSAPPAPAESLWQVVGFYRFNGNLYITLRRGDAFRTLINPRQFYVDALRAYGSLDGLIVANYTGQGKETSKFGGKK